MILSSSYRLALFLQPVSWIKSYLKILTYFPCDPSPRPSLHDVPLSSLRVYSLFLDPHILYTCTRPIPKFSHWFPYPVSIVSGCCPVGRRRPYLLCTLTEVPLGPTLRRSITYHRFKIVTQLLPSVHASNATN